MLHETSILQPVVDKYRMAMNEAGICLASCLEVPESDIRLAGNGVETAKLKEGVKMRKQPTLKSPRIDAH